MHGPWALWIWNETLKADQLCLWSVTALHNNKSSKPACSKGESWVLQSAHDGLLLIPSFNVHFCWFLDVDIQVHKANEESNWELDLIWEKKPLRNKWNEKKDFFYAQMRRGVMFLLIKCNSFYAYKLPHERKWESANKMG